MFNGFDLSTIQDAKLGSTQIQQIWYGQHLIWPTTPPHDYSQDYFTIKMTDYYVGVSPYIFFDKHGTGSLYYSSDNGATWSEMSTSKLYLNRGTYIFKGNLVPKTTSYPLDDELGIGTFELDFKSGEVSGNIMSLLYGDNFINQTSLVGKEYAFANLFRGNTYVNEFYANNLILPSDTVEGCYYRMFYYFDSGNGGLLSGPELPSTILTTKCYYGLFEHCSSLTTAPELLATTLADGSYRSLFNNCTSLNYIKCLATNISASNCTVNWTNNVAASGTFVKDASMSSWSTGTSGIPSGWVQINN